MAGARTHRWMLSVFAAMPWFAPACGNESPEASQLGRHGGNAAPQDAGLTGSGDATGEEDDDNLLVGPDRDGSWNGAKCAESTASKTLAPAYLVFLLDHSGSMGDGEHGDILLKWDPVTSALKTFFSEERSAGLYASLTLFPTDKNETNEVAGPSYPTECVAEAYERPVVDMLVLPEPDAFEHAIRAVTPPNEWGSPMRPALEGTLRYAQSLLDDDPYAHVAVVVVTDGAPAQCDDDNSLLATASVAAAVADLIPTYVIGVGTDLAALDKIAEGGGTEIATLASIVNPAETSAELLARFNQIRGEQVVCEADVPDPPSGQTLDPDKVNLDATVDGHAIAIAMNESCEGDGWRYDDPDDPTMIELCPKTCELLHSSRGSSVSIVFGCKTAMTVR